MSVEVIVACCEQEHYPLTLKRDAGLRHSEGLISRRVKFVSVPENINVVNACHCFLFLGTQLYIKRSFTPLDTEPANGHRSAALPLCRSAALPLCRSAALPLCRSADHAMSIQSLILC
jgi:hypothetical protein